MKLPTFDEWFEAKHGGPWDHFYEKPGTLISLSFRALSRELREYTSEMMQRLAQA